MISKTLRATARLLRLPNVGIMMIVIAAAVLLTDGAGIGWMSVLLAAVAGGLIGGGANAINDYFDIAIDRVNKPHRPLARGDLSPRFALAVWFVTTVGGISLNLFLHSSAFWIAVGASVALFLYSAWLKGTVLLGNILVAGMTGLALLYGGVVAGSADRALVPAMFAFLINLGREIVKDVEDMEGDRAGHAKTFPIRFGTTPSLVLASCVLIVLMGSTVVPFTTGLYGTEYLILVGVVNILVGYVTVSMWMDRSRKHLAKLNTVLKVAMLVGLAALYVGMTIV